MFLLKDKILSQLLVNVTGAQKITSEESLDLALLPDQKKLVPLGITKHGRDAFSSLGSRAKAGSRCP